MKSGEHFLVSVPVVSAVLGSVAERYSPGQLAALAVYGLGLGVLIDLDHFALARLRVGDWRHARDCLRHPKRVVFDQDNLFSGTGRLANLRLLSHVLLSGVLTALASSVSHPAGRLTAVVLYFHVLADLLRDNRIL